MNRQKRFVALLTVLAIVLITTANVPVFAKSEKGRAGDNERQRYIVTFMDPPLAAYDGRPLDTPERGSAQTQLAATAGRFNAKGKLDIRSSASQQYLQFLNERFEAFQGEAALKLGRELPAVHRYRLATNGFSTSLTRDEANTIRGLPGVMSVMIDEVQKLHTDSGPAWLGADVLFNGEAGFPASGGEGVVVGVFDTGVNWDHPSFADPGEGVAPGSGLWDHENPYGEELGLCEQPEVLCNDKLVGVYDLVEDDPDTPETEENNNGKDNSGHGSHVMSVVAGNPTSVTINGNPTEIGGVAPHANLVSYRVCYIGDAADPEDDGCQSSAILAAIDQAVADQVDVVNHSIGGSAHHPWLSFTTTYAFLNLRAAGIYGVTSAGNAGRDGPGSVGSPANAPWMMAVGAATHDRVFASVVENLSGGDTTPPGPLVGESENQGIGIRKIVYAGDYGYPLCGIGTAESGLSCDDNTGASNPFPQGTFNGEIVVCDRGFYGRVEKGKNLLLAGAGGYILANTDGWGESTYLDDLCLPSAHIGLSDANQLRTWLASGSGHQGSISGFSIFHTEEAGDIVADFSSRGPALYPVEDLVKPEVIAPGVDILGASGVANNYTFLNGTSFASPHVAGAAALLKSVHSDWTPPMLHSALVTTATPELAVDFDGSPALIDKVGAGRPRLDQAVNAGLYLDVSRDDFSSADPRRNGEPKNLNLPGLVDAACVNTCEIRRTVTDMAGGGSWTAVIEGLEEGIVATVSPQNFSLTAGASQLLTVTVDISQVELISEWAYGRLKLSSAGLPDTVLPLAVYGSGGELPDAWVINSDEISGWQDFTLSDLVAMPDATYVTGGLVEPTQTTESIVEDPSGDPYDGPSGIITVWHEVPPDTLWFHAETPEFLTRPDSETPDVDLFVGRDTNNNGVAEESEELCASTSPTEVEFCDLLHPEAGDYWVIAQNWETYNEVEDITVISAVIGKNTISRLTATGPGMTPGTEDQTVRLSWDNVSAAPGTELIGAVGIGTRRESPTNIGIIPVTFNKTDIENPATLVLMDGVERGLTLKAGAVHERMVLDIPEGVSEMTVSTVVSGEEDGMNEALSMALYRMDFENGLVLAPYARRADTSGDPVASATGTNIAGPSITLNDPASGRWYVVLNNGASVPSEIKVRAQMTFSGEPIPLSAGLWQPSTRPDLSQGFDYNVSGEYRAFLWYTYDEAGRPAWYLAAGPAPQGNVWVAELERFTNDGNLQQSTPVGHVSITMLSEQDNIFSFVLFGEEGSDRMVPTSPPLCPTVNEARMSYTGLWSRPAVGVGGSSVMVNEATQGYLHYIYDSTGQPVWLLGADVNEGLPQAEIPLLQFSGYCAVCAGDTPTSEEVGLFTLDYSDETTASWNLNYVLAGPLSGSVNRSDDVIKLTTPLVCQ
jgi:subtilisin family serine protease